MWSRTKIHSYLATVLALSLASTAAATDGRSLAKSYVSPMVIPAAAFQNDGQNPDGFDFRNGGVEGLGARVHMVAPVYLPDDAVITGFHAYVYDNSAVCGFNQEDVEIFLLRTNLVDGVEQVIAITTSAGANDAVDYEPTHTLNTGAATVHNGSYHYWLHMRLCSFSHRVSAVVIDYD